MKRRLPILLVIAGFGSLFSSGQPHKVATPLERYVEILRQNGTDTAASRFAGACGVDLKGVAATFWVTKEPAGGWEEVKDMPHAIDLELHNSVLVRTAEVWKPAHRIFIETWDARVNWGTYIRNMYCVEEGGRVRSVDATDFEVSEDGSQRYALHMRWARNAKGVFAEPVPMEFVDPEGRTVPRPKLTSDDEHFVKQWNRFPPGAENLDGLGLRPVVR